ncbi:amidohydrolase family protein [bacterium]|nr:amidohydrolase family protein [bacterium]
MSENDITTVFSGGILIDGNGQKPISDAIVIITGNIIAYAGKASTVEIPQNVTEIDITGNVIMPGLIDSHVHLQGLLTTDPKELIMVPPEVRAIRSTTDLLNLLDAGYTAVRDCGDLNAIYLKTAVSEGSIIGPRIFACGTMICQTAGHGDPFHSLPEEWVIQRGLVEIADGADQCRQAARKQLRRGADFIKICTTGGVLSERDAPAMSQYTIEEIRALTETAYAGGVMVSTHAQGATGIKNALKAGVDIIEHGSLADDEAIEMMVKQDTMLVPTLSLGRVLASLKPGSGVPALYIDKAKRVVEEKIKTFDKSWRSGIRIGCGSDFLSDPISPMGENAVELEHQVKSGRSTMDVIVSATKINSQILGAEDRIGTIEKGKLADLIIIDGNPLEDISILRNRSKIVRVYKNGKLMPRYTNGKNS